MLNKSKKISHKDKATIKIAPLEAIERLKGKEFTIDSWAEIGVIKKAINDYL